MSKRFNAKSASEFITKLARAGLAASRSPKTKQVMKWASAFMGLAADRALQQAPRARPKVSRTVYRPRVARVPRPLPSIPASYPQRFFRPRFSMRSVGDEVHIDGMDIVSPYIGRTELDCVIPVNPIYWNGTRVAGVALNYSQYRPMKFKVHFVTFAGTNNNSFVYMGTMWDNPPPGTDLKASLVTSNGGGVTAGYRNLTSDVALGRNLRMNLFDLRDPMSKDSNPFFHLISTGLGGGDATSNAISFTVFVEYSYCFRNPVGSGFVAGSKYSTIADLIGTGVSRQVPDALNEDFVTLQEFTSGEGITFPAGTLMHLINDEDGLHDVVVGSTRIPIVELGSTLVVKYFFSGPGASVSTRSPLREVDLSDWNSVLEDTPVAVTQGMSLMFQTPEDLTTTSAASFKYAEAGDIVVAQTDDYTSTVYNVPAGSKYNISYGASPQVLGDFQALYDGINTTINDLAVDVVRFSTTGWSVIGGITSSTHRSRPLKSDLNTPQDVIENFPTSSIAKAVRFAQIQNARKVKLPNPSSSAFA